MWDQERAFLQKIEGAGQTNQQMSKKEGKKDVYWNILLKDGLFLDIIQVNMLILIDSFLRAECTTLSEPLFKLQKLFSPWKHKTKIPWVVQKFTKNEVMK